MKPQVPKSFYESKDYMGKQTWMSYYYQTCLIKKLNPSTILEIGVGNKFLKKFFSDTPIKYKTLDIAQDLKPDHIGSIDDIPLKDGLFDAVCAFQVLEHLPFDKFEQSLKEMSRVCKRWVLISLPFAGFHFGFSIKFGFPSENELSPSLTLPRSYKKIKFNGQHYWEIGSRGYSLGKIKKTLSKYFNIRETLHPYENKYHMFFVLEKK